MIDLKVDFSLLNKFFGIQATKIPQYANKDIEEIMEIEAAQGNQKAQDYDKILADPDKLLEIFKLSNVENKFIILQNMSEADLDNLLPYLKHDQLTIGLNFFTEEKLVEMAQYLPIEELSNMIMQKFSTFDIMKFMDDNAMNQFLNQPDVERKYAQKYFESMKGEDLRKMMVRTKGVEWEEKSQKESLEYLNNLDDSKFKEFLFSMERGDKMNLINGITEQNKDLINLFKPDELTAPMNLLMKEDKVKLLSTLDDEFIIPMIQELPLDLTQIVLTQIDPQDFSEILATEFQDVMKSVVLFSGKAA